MQHCRGTNTNLVDLKNRLRPRDTTCCGKNHKNTSAVAWNWKREGAGGNENRKRPDSSQIRIRKQHDPSQRNFKPSSKNMGERRKVLGGKKTTTEGTGISLRSDCMVKLLKKKLGAKTESFLACLEKKIKVSKGAAKRRRTGLGG